MIMRSLYEGVLVCFLYFFVSLQNTALTFSGVGPDVLLGIGPRISLLVLIK